MLLLSKQPPYLLFSDSGLDSIVFGFCSGSWSHLLSLVTFGWFLLDGLSTVHGLQGQHQKCKHKHSH